MIDDIAKLSPHEGDGVHANNSQDGGCKIICVNGRQGIVEAPTLNRRFYGH